MFSSIFEEMMEKVVIKKCDPKILAFAYTTPIASLIHLCDRDPDREDKAMGKLEAFMKMFIDEHGIQKGMLIGLCIGSAISKKEDKEENDET